MQRLLDGYRRFRTEVFPTHSSLFKQLAHGQKPDIALITCSDSRVMPELILQSSPGQVFPIRNAGNLVPPPGEAHSGVAASIEYAVRVLNVRDIVICGHSGCGAIKAILESNPQPEAGHDRGHEPGHDLPMVQAWLRHAGASALWLKGLLEDVPKMPLEKKLNLMIQANVLTQLSHLAQHPSVAEGLSKQTLGIHGWVYDIPTGEIVSLDNQTGMFLPLPVTTHATDLKVA